MRVDLPGVVGRGRLALCGDVARTRGPASSCPGLSSLPAISVSRTRIPLIPKLVPLAGALTLCQGEAARPTDVIAARRRPRLPCSLPSLGSPWLPRTASCSGERGALSGRRKIKIKTLRKVTLQRTKYHFIIRLQESYMAVQLKDQDLTNKQQQVAKDFLQKHLYGRGCHRTTANQYFSVGNKRSDVKKAAFQFVNKSWGNNSNAKPLKRRGNVPSVLWRLRVAFAEARRARGVSAHRPLSLSRLQE
uniref:Nucleolar protein 7 n=1 Tax=Podarcis muralis TaxID=64176 RepID=A0A670IRU7_PODMU